VVCFGKNKWGPPAKETQCKKKERAWDEKRRTVGKDQEIELKGFTGGGGENRGKSEGGVGTGTEKSPAGRGANRKTTKGKTGGRSEFTKKKERRFLWVSSTGKVG